MAGDQDLLRRDLTVWAEAEEIVLALPQPIVLQGNVLAQGRSCGTCRVIFTGDGPDAGTRQAQMDISGEYVVRLAHAGTYRVLLEDEASGARVVRSLLVSRSQNLDLVLSPLTVKGTVMDGEDRPVPGARVVLHALLERRVLDDTVADQEGRFQLVCPAPGAYELAASSEQAITAREVSVPVGGAEGIVLTL